MADNAAYKKFRDRLKQIRKNTLAILRKSSERSDDKKAEELRQKLDRP